MKVDILREFRHSGTMPELSDRPRVAIGILSHSYPDLLDQLIRRLITHFDIYLHVDRGSRMDISHYEWANRVTLLRRRRTYWGSFRCTEAIMDYLRAAHSVGYQHYLLISGQDIPIKSNEEILSALSASPHHDFIQSLPLPSPILRGGLERITRRYWHAPYRYQGLRKAAYWIVEYALEAGYRTFLQPKVLAGSFFWGETWFTLRHSTVGAILEYLEKNPGFQKIFFGSRLAEEVFLQTLIRRIDPPADIAPDTSTYIDWEGGSNGSPKTLDQSDLARVKAAPHLFARKIHPEVSKELIETLYA